MDVPVRLRHISYKIFRVIAFIGDLMTSKRTRSRHLGLCCDLRVAVTVAKNVTSRQAGQSILSIVTGAAAKGVGSFAVCAYTPTVLYR